MTSVAHLTTGLALYAYLPMNPCGLPQRTFMDPIFFTDAFGESAITSPSRGCIHASMMYTSGQYHMVHRTGHTTYEASSHGELGALADTISKLAGTQPTDTFHILRVSFIVDATVDTHLLLRMARRFVRLASRNGFRKSQTPWGRCLLVVCLGRRISNESN